MCIDLHSEALKVQNSEVLIFDCMCVQTNLVSTGKKKKKEEEMALSRVL